MSRTEVRRLIKGIEELLNTEIPGTPRIGGRVMYVALPGTGSKSKDVLSPRAQQVMAFLARNRKASSQALQKALKVNRNVIAGAVHELKQAKFVRSERFEPDQVAAESRPRRAVAADAPRRRKKAKS
jgi:DNA segregation ATPase FtsK/SpoIIIE-like protein